MRRAPFGQNYAFVVAAVAFVALLVTAALRFSNGVLIGPWQSAFGWDRSVISLAAATGIFMYGLAGPFAAAVMQTLGVRLTMLAGLGLMAVSMALTLIVREPWQLIATWGVLSGLGSGCVAMVLAATIVNRWFVRRRGLVSGLLTASTASGTLIFLPLFGAVAERFGWKPVVMILGAAMVAVIPLVLLLMPERPEDIGQRPYGADPDAPAAPPAAGVNPAVLALRALATAARNKDFWLMFGGFYICGLTTNGLVGTHLISYCTDNGLALTTAAGILAMMGIFDLFGTTGSGWLTDRYDARKLLFIYYALRGLSLIYLPYSDFSLLSLTAFAAFYGLEWVATVPPTIRLATQSFGETLAPIVFGWIFMGHQLGAATAAFAGGAIRGATGSYLSAFLIAGGAALIAAVMSLMIGKPRSPEATLQPA